MCWVRWCLSPPLSYGAPRFLSAADTTARALESFNQSLSEPEEALPRSREQLVGYARDGWERASDRLKGIESRAATFVQTAGLTTTVVLVNNALLTGNNRINGHSRGVFVGALVAASTLLLVAGMYALFATMRTFGRVAPDHPSRIISRARLLDDEAFRRQTIAALLVAQRRTSIVADWKLARLKRASFAFGLAIVAIAVASSAYVFEVTGANSRSSRVTPAESHASTPSHLARLTSIMESLRPAGVHQGGDQIPLATELSGRVARAWKAELTLAPFVASSV